MQGGSSIWLIISRVISGIISRNGGRVADCEGSGRAGRGVGKVASRPGDKEAGDVAGEVSRITGIEIVDRVGWQGSSAPSPVQVTLRRHQAIPYSSSSACNTRVHSPLYCTRSSFRACNGHKGSGFCICPHVWIRVCGIHFVKAKKET